ncbi:MAG: hypothetical protein LBG76_05535 [Treponema sp.]|jgi:hypothetical protein|nr:hypothetical protein [Treponema sp.]
MRRIFLPLPGVVLLAACAGTPALLPMPVPTLPPVTPERAYEIVDYKAKESGEALPEWVSQYLSGGIAGVEALPEYAGAYVFIEETVSARINALNQEALGFSLNQDFPRLVAARVLARLTGAAGGEPDRIYGRYFEDLVKNSIDAGYSGARIEADFWLLRRYEEEDGTDSTPMYSFFLLVRIERNLLKSQLNKILNTAAQGTREQIQAIERLKTNFYEDF